ncbi:hypothetical protein [Methanoculleus sp. 10]|uniref:hypothetical protein n=1 Tax=Methanoculleus sp. 10 TaxID=430615 RepID=UPI0025D6E420|nr:hypothetical protein [Methanoculleus sp. 10]
MEVEVGGQVVAGDLSGVFLVGDEPDLDIANPFRRGCFAEGDTDYFCSEGGDFLRGKLNRLVALIYQAYIK